MTTATMDTLLPILRLKLGDTDSTSYRYIDDWLRTSLEASVSALSRYWDSKYIMESGDIVRNSAYAYFETTTPVIQVKDAWIIILMASVIVKSGQLENLSWDIGSWHDSELSFSNIATGQQKDLSLKKDLDELASYIKVPTKRPVLSIRTAFVDQT